MHQRDEDHHIPGHGHTVAPHSAVLTPVLDPDQDPDQDLGLTPILPVGPGPAHAPMVGRIPAPLILDVMDAVMDDHGLGPVLVQGLMGIGALAHHDRLHLTGEVVGREQKDLDPDLTGLDRGLAPPVASVVVVLVDENHLLGS